MNQEKNDVLKHKKQAHLTMMMKDLLLIHWDNQQLELDTNEEDLL